MAVSDADAEVSQEEGEARRSDARCQGGRAQRHSNRTVHVLPPAPPLWPSPSPPCSPHGPLPTPAVPALLVSCSG